MVETALCVNAQMELLAEYSLRVLHLKMFVSSLRTRRGTLSVHAPQRNGSTPQLPHTAVRRVFRSVAKVLGT